MVGALVLLLMAVCYTAGWFHADAAHWIRDHRALPPATPRAIARVARRNRADLRDVRPAGQAGVRVTGVRVVDRRELDAPRLGEPPNLMPDIQAFDKEHTQP